MISRWPVRSGVVADGETVTFCGGLFPSQGVYLCTASAADGKVIRRQQIDVSPQGYMFASSRSLLLPTGRTAPAVFDRDRLKKLGNLGSIGGCFALVADDMLVHGPSENGRLHIKQGATGYRFSIDAIVLAHLTDTHAGETILDLGTGCGIIPLILAYRNPTSAFMALKYKTN